MSQILGIITACWEIIILQAKSNEKQIVHAIWTHDAMADLQALYDAMADLQSFLVNKKSILQN